MRGMRRSLLAIFAIVLATPATAPAQQPVVYSSLPLQGEAAAQTRDIVRGIDLANEHAGNPVRHVSLDDSTQAAAYWTPERVARNARRAARDDATAAYIGEFNSGASAISLPILNEAGILQVSPSNTFVGLTQGGIGADDGEPEKYYPTGQRTYGRVVPNDRVQAAAAATLIRDLGVKRLYVVHDGEVYGRGVARLAARGARARGVRVVRMRRLRWRLGGPPTNVRTLAREARRVRADGLFFGGITTTGGPFLWRAVARNRRLRWLVGADGIAETGFVHGVPRRALVRTRVMVQTLAPRAYPASGQEVLAALGNADPYALYGYEAMSVILDAFARGGRTREGTVRAFFETRDRDSVLGRYSIGPTGDTSLTQYGVYRMRRRSLVWDRVVDAAAP
jgi:branched-chain amino acid transport system substrate-binding protein